MNFTGEITKKGTTTAGVYLIEYNIMFDAENKPLKASVRVCKSNVMIAQASYRTVRSQFSVGFVDTDMLPADDRVLIYTTIENDLKKVFK